MAVNFTPEQQKVIDLQGCNILVSAAAGSGKTAVLTERIVKKVCDETNPVDIDRLLIVTFTNAAAAEMRERIAAGIAAKLEEHPDSEHIQRQATLLHNAQITTIDSFCLFLLRNHFNEVGLDPAFRIADEGEIRLMQQDVLKEMIEDAYASGEEAFREGIREYMKSFPYGNATWDELIEIMDRYTDVDLRNWSQAWVGEKGMPELTATIEGDELVVRQQDAWGRGLIWPQQLAYQLYSHGKTQLVTLNSDAAEVRVKLEHLPTDAWILPNVDGRGYGFFRLDEPTAATCWEVLRTSTDEVLRGSLLITLFENLRRQAIDPKAFRSALLAYLPQEPNALLFSMALGYLGNCQALFPADAAPVEEALWQLVTTAEEPSRRLQAFRLYRNVVESTAGKARLYTIWEQAQAPKGCYLS